MSSDSLATFWGVLSAMSIVKICELLLERYMKPRVTIVLQHSEEQLKKLRERLRSVGEKEQ